MKKFTYLLVALVMTLLVACSSNEQEKSGSKENSATETKEEKKDEKKEETVNVDKGLLNVELTIPASMFEGVDLDSVIANAKNKGVKEVIKNEDGSLTYKMSKAKHKEMMKELETSIKDSIEEAKTSGDFVSIKDITYNNSFTKFTLVVDKAAYENSMDGFAALGFGLSGMMYQLYNGTDSEDTKVTISVVDEITKEIFDEIVYPDAFEDQETNQ